MILHQGSDFIGVKRKKDLNDWLSKVPRNVDFVVLAPFALDELRATVHGHAASRIRAIEHPYLFVPPHTATASKHERSPIFGWIPEGHEHWAETVSRIQVEHGPIVEVGIAAKARFTDVSPVPYEQFSESLMGLDYLLIIKEQAIYTARASSQYLDAASAGVPWIALRNRFAEHVQDVAGENGFICDSLDELHGKIAELSGSGERLGETEKYMLANRQLRAHFSTTSIGVSMLRSLLQGAQG